MLLLLEREHWDVSIIESIGNLCEYYCVPMKRGQLMHDYMHNLPITIIRFDDNLLFNFATCTKFRVAELGVGNLRIVRRISRLIVGCVGAAQRKLCQLDNVLII